MKNRFGNIIHSDQWSFAYFFINRVGSTTLSKWICDLHGIDTSKARNNQRLLRETFSIEDTNALAWGHLYKFICVRDPYTRFISSLLLITRPDNGANNVHSVLRLYGLNADKHSLCHLLEKMCRQPNRLERINEHFFPQHSFFEIQNIAFFDQVLRLETFQKDFETLQSNLKVPKYALEWKNSTQINNEALPTDLTCLPLSQITLAKVKSYEVAFLTPEVKKMIAEVYAGDFDMFNYKR